MSKIFNFAKGKIGEIKASRYLKKKFYKILEVNYMVPFGEIDIICKKKEKYIFVEVKARDSINFGYPREAVNFAKQQKIKRVAQYYIMLNKLEDKDIRFDVLEIIGDKITHIENAFNY